MRADARRNAEKLRTAAAEPFRERGLHVSLKEIVRRAGVSHGTLYNLYGSREALIDEVITDLAARRQEDAAARAVATRTPGADSRWLCPARWLALSTALADLGGRACREHQSRVKALKAARAEIETPKASPVRGLEPVDSPDRAGRPFAACWVVAWRPQPNVPYVAPPAWSCTDGNAMNSTALGGQLVIRCRFAVA